MKSIRVALIPVRLGNGVVIMHTREEFERLMRGVDREIAQDAMSSTPLREDDEP